ncbi:endospore germination permease [Psychrobacillus sp. FSL H8-0484]|uniref:GerAB/ArcD/ProY family transporter n=1 Tax=Psychrobacillus sp. FSL H8-0484 TaxID=2921390 RepID=UPI0030F609EF
MQNGKINSFQFLVLVVFFSVGTSILYVPSILSSQVKQDAWIVAIIGTGIGQLVIWLFTTIAMWFPTLTYTEVNEKIFGKIIGKTISFLFVLMCILYTSALLSHSGTFLITQMFPKTPILALNILMALLVVIAVRLGLETIARSAEIFIFVFLFLFILLTLTISPKINFENLEPFFQENIGSLLHSSIAVVVVSSVNSIVLFMIFPAFIKDIEKAKKNFFIGNAIGGIIVSIITLLCIFVLGSTTTARQVYPSYALAKVINVGNFLTRIEALMATLWILGLFFKAVLYFYAAIFGLKQIFNLKDYRSLTSSLGVIIVVLSVIIFPNILYQLKFDSKVSIALSLIIGFFFPLLLVVIYTIRKKKLKKDPDHS